MKLLFIGIVLFTLGDWFLLQLVLRLFPLSTEEMRAQNMKRDFYIRHFPRVSWLWRAFYPRPRAITHRAAFWHLALLTLLLLGIVVTEVLSILFFPS